MKSLIITAHPSKDGFTHEIAKKYKEKIEKNDGKAEVLDLYKTEFAENFLNFGKKRGWPNKTVLKKYQSKVKNSDEVIFVFPVWWYDCPSIMKNFFECVFARGFSHKFSKGKIEGLLGGKTARIFATADGPNFYYFLTGGPIKKLWKRRLNLCGIKLVGYELLGGKSSKKKSEQRKWLNDILNKLFR